MHSEVMSKQHHHHHHHRSKSPSDHHRSKSPTTEKSHAHLVDVTEVWLICAPGDKTPKATYEAVNNATTKGGRRLSANFKFHIPELKASIFCICFTSLH